MINACASALKVLIMKIALIRKKLKMCAIACNKKDSVTSPMYGEKLSNTLVEFKVDE